MRGDFVIKSKIVGSGPTLRFAVYEDLGFPGGLTWNPWFTTSDKEEAERYAREARQIAKDHPRTKLAGRYWCEASPRSQSWGPQFNIYQPEGFFGLGSKLVHSTYSLDAARAWAERAEQLAA